MSSVTEPSRAKPATAARIYDYLLDGVHNFPADREVAQKVIAALPHVREAAQANRAFLGRAVRYLAEQGIDQFIDIGSGLPTQGNVHEIAHAVRPEARVVYVDIDPLAVAESLDLLAQDDRATAVRGDLREPEAILAHPEVRRVLDLNRPVGLLLFAVLHFVIDDDLAYGVVERVARELVSGSYLAASHGATETPLPPEQAESMERAYDQRTTTGSGKPRTREEFARFFAGWDVVEPGLVWVPQWRPDGQVPAEMVADPTISGCWAGVA
ncbi:MAG: SAM-dependent methyltransferase, partial [Betaproteobacteria bacterium]